MQKVSKGNLIQLLGYYFESSPLCSDVQYDKGILKLQYSYYNPYICSYNKLQQYHALTPIEKQTSIIVQQNIPNLVYDSQNKILKQSNSFDCILTKDYHENIQKQQIFGSPDINEFRTKWVYVAQKKHENIKSYFVGGCGNYEYKHDYGQEYKINDVGIFIWDMQNRQIFEVQIVLDNVDDEFTFLNPIFIDDEGDKIICHGFKKQGINVIESSFHRSVSIFQTHMKKVDKKWHFQSKMIINKQETCIFPKLSPCKQFMMYYGGSGEAHNYYMDLVVLQLSGNYWKQIHRKQDAFVGYMHIAYGKTIQYQKQMYAYYHTVQQARNVVRCINLRTGSDKLILKQLGKSFYIKIALPQLNTIIGTVHSLSGNKFYMKQSNGDLSIFQRKKYIDSQDYIIEEFHTQIHAYFIQSRKQTTNQIQKPMIIMIHGGPHGYNEPVLNPFIYLLLEMGYTILMPNYTGSIGYGKQYCQKLIGKITEQNALQIISLLNHVLQKKPYLKKNKISLYGSSYGGYLTLKLSSSFSQYFHKGIILNGPNNPLALMYNSNVPDWVTGQILGRRQYCATLTGQQYDKILKLLIQQPVNIPIIQFMGKQDKTVIFNQSLLSQAITKKNKQFCKSYVYENQGHFLCNSLETVIDIAVKSILFLQDKYSQL